jgi:F-type H+-transporting ATPase subunit gamma
MVNHLDHESENLARRCNTLRQEEIIEEIEVILLSSGLPHPAVPNQPGKP